MNKTGISWTDLTWNPVSGCSKVSPGCQNCYAEAWSHRWNRSFEVTLHPEKLDEVKKIPSGSKVFVNSMSDLFHEKVPFDFIEQVFDACSSRPDVVFQILTKRPQRAVEFMKYMYEESWGGIGYWGGGDYDPNIWIGASVEDDKAKWRVEWLKKLHQHAPWHLFISFEPLIGDVGALDFSIADPFYPGKVDWIIIGGESGPRHRPMKVEWAQNLVKQAKAQGVAVWMKQMGGSRPGGELKDFPEDLRLREFPHYELGGTP